MLPQQICLYSFPPLYFFLFGTPFHVSFCVCFHLDLLLLFYFLFLSCFPYCFLPALYFISTSSFFSHHPSLFPHQSLPNPSHGGTALLACSLWLLPLWSVKSCLSVQGNRIDLFCSYNLISVLSKGLKRATARSASPQWDIAGENSGLLVLSLALVPRFCRIGPHQPTVDQLTVILKILICLEYFLLFIHLAVWLPVISSFLFIYWG